jgi:L-threonylcarbamoyladenylate synthase
MPEVFDITDPDQLVAGLRHARLAIGRKQVVVIPTDTSYALAVNAFSPASVALLREVKGWTTPIPPQVLLPGIPTLQALAAVVEPSVDTLTQALWPGALTVIVPAGESLQWDLGDNKGTVALRMPADQAARELLADTGPLAVTQATPLRADIARDPDAIQEAFSDLVAVYLLRGTMEASVPSTVVDATGLGYPTGHLRILREGAIARQELYALVGEETFHPPILEDVQAPNEGPEPSD